LSTSVQLVSRAVASVRTHPLLANVPLTADAAAPAAQPHRASISASASRRACGGGANQRRPTPASRLFGEIARGSSPKGPITRQLREGRSKVELTSLLGSYQMRAYQAEDFPDLPLLQTAPRSASTWNRCERLRANLFAMQADD